MRDEAERKSDSEAVDFGARRCRDAAGVSVRRARPEDVDFITELLAHEEVEPFLSPHRSGGREEVLERIERSTREPNEFGVFVIEVDGRSAGMMGFEEGNRRSRIANLGALAVHPDFRGRGVAEEAAREFQRHLLLDLGYHRLQAEVYEFNESSIRHSDRSGFVREGERRKAYWRHGSWVGSVLYALNREDLGFAHGIDLAYEYLARHNMGVRHGDWAPVGELLAEDAILEFEGIELGPFHGREAVVAAYAGRPPTDEVRVLEWLDNVDLVVAKYAWAARPEEVAGFITIRLVDGLIVQLTVTV